MENGPLGLAGEHVQQLAGMEHKPVPGHVITQLHLTGVQTALEALMILRLAMTELAQVIFFFIFMH